MKKFGVLAAILLTLGTISAQAQLKFGIKAGVNLPKVVLSGDNVVNDNIKNITGFQVGPTVEFTVPLLGVGMDASVLYSQDGFKWAGLQQLLGKDSYKANTLEVPLNLKYKLSFLDLVGAYATVGPYFNFRLSDNLQEQYKDKTFGVGLSFGLGIELIKHLQVGASYRLGLTDNYGPMFKTIASLANSDIKSTKVRGWVVSATYFF